ncbi:MULTISPECIES: ABC transporter ATP-binding protein [unclassified Microbacterium]|uniref:ABC transporter ATP-binding protein n=1 Tax=unclassified Microbacterium TaxID=2609290 RepID=UPI000B362764|nr:ABC transporter ATP-binding protein [Microbacterium sp. JB110]RCS61361.1 ABC transporter ATP-binding protein [Microbacterium sp. JB110]
MTLLELTDVHASYAGGNRVLHGVSLNVDEGGVTTLLGANGAGKTTTLRAICGMVGRRGTIRFDGRDLTHMRADRVARLGIAHVPQGRGTLTGLTVRENLDAGAALRRDRAQVRKDLDFYFELFPRLVERGKQKGSSLSGGEQQMLAIARALMGAPRLVLLDEPSLGLAPKVTSEVFETISTLRRETGVAMLIVEQNPALVLDMADDVIVLENGRVAASGSPAELSAQDAIRRAYLGGGE